MKIFAIQSYNDEILHDFSITLLGACKYQNWINSGIVFDHILVENIDEINDCTDIIPIGSVEFVIGFIEKFYNKKPKPINIPIELLKMKYTKRDVIYSNNVELNEIKFVKSTEKFKGFTEITKNVPDGSYLISDVVEFKSEWRAFVFKNKMVGLQNYLGEFDIFPDVSLINEMINEYSNAPIAYTLDVGVLDNNETAIIEVHDFFSCGLYGFSNYNVIPYMFTRWFYEFINK